MKDIKLLLACGLLFGLTAGLGGCDVDDEEDCETGDCTEDDGGMGGMGGEGGMGGNPGAEYRYVIIGDDTTDENTAGTPGADICGLVANCGADDFTATGANVVIGGGTVCDGTSMAAPCESGVNRGNPIAALDNGGTCEPTSDPSDYVSLGLTGELAVEFNVDLTGCNITIVELEGRQNEPYSVYICQTETLDAATCLNGGQAIANSPAAGGSVSVDVPTP